MNKFIIMILIITCIIAQSSLYTSFGDDINTNSKEITSGIPLSDLEKSIDDYVSNYIGKTTPGAAIGVVRDGEIVFLKGYGYADIENKIPVDPKKTIFEWASTSKLFTWTSVMQLVEKNKIELDKDVKQYIPREVAEKLEYNQSFTMKDIMNHSAGFGDYAFNTIVFSPEKLVTLEEAILRDKPKQYYKVGTASAYSNYTASLAGYIVQTISNKPYEEYVRENIFEVLSMDDTSFNPILPEDNKVKAKGYIPDEKGSFNLGKWSYVSHTPAGAINGTAEDFLKYALALTPAENEKSKLFKKKETLKNMLSPSYDTYDKMIGTAHGFFQYKSEKPAFGHGGNTAAFSSQFTIVPEDRLGIVILTNAYLEMDILFGLQDILTGNQIDEVKIPDIELPLSKKVEGKYVPMERQEGNFVDFAKYISLYKIKATGTNEITMNIGPYKGTYLQTEPYRYEIINDNIPLFRNAYPALEFDFKNDSVSHIIVGNGMDLSALPIGRTIPFLASSVAILLINILFFTVYPLILIINLIKNRKKGLGIEYKKFNRYNLILVMLGTATIINNLIPSGKMMINNFRTFAEMKPHIIFNYPLLIGTIVAAFFSTKYLRKIETKKRIKILYIFTLALLTSLFAILYHWNFFDIVG